MDQPRGQVHQLLHDGADTPALGTVPWRGVRAEQAVLPNPTQNVVGELSTGKDQRVGGEFARRQTLDVQVGLELAVVLLNIPSLTPL